MGDFKPTTKIKKLSISYVWLYFWIHNALHRLRDVNIELITLYKYNKITRSNSLDFF